MATATAPSTSSVPRLKAIYRNEIVPALKEEFGFTNPHQVPGIVKVVVNTGVGEAARDSKVIEGAIKDLTAITGQKPIVTNAKVSIAQFKLREGMPIGAHVTMRGNRAWEFLDRLINLALPRIRDFRGMSDRQFDGTVTTPLVSLSSRCSTKSTRTTLIAFAASTSPLSPPQRMTMKVEPCCAR